VSDTFFFLLAVLGFDELRALLARQVFCHLSYTSCPFVLVILETGSLLLFVQATLNHDPPMFNFSLMRGRQAHITMLCFFLLRWSIANFLAWAGLRP
jgi:hypothetical protein